MKLRSRRSLRSLRISLIRHRHIPFLKEVFYASLADDLVQKQAADIQSGTTSAGRTSTDHFQDCLNGHALELAGACYLESLGHRVDLAPPKDKHYDLIVNGILIDVKGRFTGNSPWYSQTPYERSTIKQSKANVLYLCIDCRSDRFYIDGECWTSQMKSSTDNPGGGYIHSTSLCSIL